MISYLDENDPNINNDILYRKEFQLFKKNIDIINKTNKFKQDDKSKNIIPKFLLDEYLKHDNYLDLHSYQLFVQNYLNPNTPYSRLLLKWETGTGKTIGALTIALNFINYYQKEEYMSSSSIENELGSVFIIGFTQNIFKAELLRFPEFGFISREELHKYNKLKKRSYSGIPSDVEKLQKMSLQLKKRIYSRKGNGFFKFLGYKELFNHLFINKNDIKINLHSMSENELKEAIKNGDIIINKELLDSFRNSLIICDEIHNVYNSLEKNNWGIAIQTILNYHDSCRALFLSATPLNNSPTELVDLLNLLLPRKLYNVMKKQDFFDLQNNIIESKKELLSNLLKGRISFIRDTNPKFFAKKNFIGEKLPTLNENITFIRTPMSKFHYNTYLSIINEKNDTLNQESQYLVDFALPDPNFADPFKHTGLYKTSDIKSILSNVPTKWKNKYDIYYDNKNDIISGELLNKDKYLDIISNKYYTMINRIHDKIKKKKGKIFIFHNTVHMSGTLFIQEILLKNGIIGEFHSSNDNTICVICGKIRKLHNKNQLVVLEEKKGGNDIEININEIIYKKNSINDIFEICVYHDNNLKKLFEYYTFEDRIIILTNGISDDVFNNDKIKELFINYINNSNENIIIQIYNSDTDDEVDNKFNKIFDKLNGYNFYNHSDYLFYYNQTKNKLFNSNSKYINDFIDKLYLYIKNISYSINGGNDDHYYKPTRFIIVHSDLDKKQINNSLEKYNHVNNVYGDKFLILIGSKIIKESYSINSVKNMMVMTKPDNISTLIQIIGRAVRLNSHNLLPIDERFVDIELYTSCLPIKKNNKYILGYEEKKYIQKFKIHKIIQQIEKLMHENTIDSYFNYSSIWNNDSKNNALSILPYTPNIGKNNTKLFKLNELNLSSFNAYHAYIEVDYIFYMIKRLFIEISSIWKYNDLFNAIKNPPFEVEIDVSLISQDLFNIALNKILFRNSDQYIEPKINKINNSIDHNLIDKIRDPSDKIIFLNDKIYSITQIHDYYIMTIINSNYETELDIELINRSHIINKPIYIDISNFLQYDLDHNYNNKKQKFITKWEKVSINNLELAMRDYGLNFHQKIIEECIEYIFNIWVNPKQEKSEYHIFFLKFLYYYDLQKLIIWGNTVNDTLYKKYNKYIIPVDTKIIDKQLEKNIEKDSAKSSGLINMLKANINKSSSKWVSTGMIDEFTDKLKKTNDLYEGIYKKNKIFKKVPADILPVGHGLTEIPRFYMPDMGGWINDPSFIESSKFIKENSIVIGYDERSSTGISIKFKLRNPIQNIKQYKDTRSIEKGSVCSTKSKIYIKEIAKKLDIELDKNKKINVDDLCMKIRTKLIYYELKEQMKPEKDKKLKFFYFIYQNRPETVQN
jgi:hypothetical protein